MITWSLKAGQARRPLALGSNHMLTTVFGGVAVVALRSSVTPRAQHHTLVPPIWSGSFPEGVSPIKAPTPTGPDRTDHISLRRLRLPVSPGATASALQIRFAKQPDCPAVPKTFLPSSRLLSHGRDRRHDAEDRKLATGGNLHAISAVIPPAWHHCCYQMLAHPNSRTRNDWPGPAEATGS
jgi:hypothetical protein